MANELEKDQKTDEPVQLREFDDERMSEEFLLGLREFMDDEVIKELNISDTDSFKITSREQANYFIKKVIDAKSEQDNVNHVADNEIAKTSTRVNQWRQQELDKRQRDIDYISNLLRAFAEEELKNNKGKTKSISLPYGSIGFKKQQDKYEYDEEALLAFLKEDKELEKKYVKYKPSPDKTALKKDGEAKNGKLYLGDTNVPGVTVTPQEEKFEVKG